MRRRRYNVAIVGATGVVGAQMLQVLHERRFPVHRLRLLASSRSAGRRLAFQGVAHRVEVLRNRAFEGIDLALFSAGAARSLTFAPEAVRRGAVVIDNSSAFRQHARVPLVVPEVNAHALEGHAGLIANPNCSTIIMVLALAPLHAAAGLRRVVVATYQSVSGAGAQAMAQLYRESQQSLRQSVVNRSQLRVRPRLATGRGTHSMVLPGQIAFNLLPQVDVFLANRGTKEEVKMVQETRKILGMPTLAISATCVRVPVFVGHSEAVWAETRAPLSAARARTLLRRSRGIRLLDDPRRGLAPQPIVAAGQDVVLVGRVRQDASVRHGLVFWVAGDNLRKGAATNAVQIAERVVGTR